MLTKTTSLKLIPLLLITLTFLVYYPVLGNDFVIRDTGDYLINNPNIKALTWQNIQWMFTTFYEGNWTPLAWLSHAIAYAMFGLNPWGHHLIDLLIHCGNTVLFFWLVFLLIHGHARQISSQFTEHHALWIAGIAACLFGIHPQHVESVAWIAERKGLLAAFFILLTLISYLAYGTATLFKQRWGWYLLTLLNCLAALLSKPLAVTLPILMFLLDIYPMQRTFQKHPHGPPLRQLVLEKLPFLLLSGAVVSLAIFAQSESHALASYQEVDLSIRMLNVFSNIWWYISKFLFPLYFSPHYAFPAFGELARQHLWFVGIPILAFMLMTIYCSYLWYKRQFHWLIIWLFYLIALAPMSGVIQFGDAVTADRFAYVPTLPFYLLVAAGSVRLLIRYPQSRSLPITLLVSFIGISMVLSALTRQQIPVWKNELSLWNHAVISDPDDPVAQGGLANIFYLLGEYEKAAKHYQFAVITGGHDIYRLKLADTYLTLSRYEQALKVCQEVVERNILNEHEKAMAYYMMGIIFYEQDALKAKKMLEHALRLDPHHQAAQELLLKITFSR